jgi:hypothetical protein
VTNCAVNQIIARFDKFPDPQNRKKCASGPGQFPKTTTVEEAAKYGTPPDSETESSDPESTESTKCMSIVESKTKIVERFLIRKIRNNDDTNSTSIISFRKLLGNVLDRRYPRFEALLNGHRC